MMLSKSASIGSPPPISISRVPEGRFTKSPVTVNWPMECPGATVPSFTTAGSVRGTSGIAV